MDRRAEMNGWLQKVFDDDDIREGDWEIDGGSEKGDGYSGDVAFLTLRVARDCEPLRLVVKSSKRNEIARILNLNKVYGNEITVYTKIFPAFDEFAKARGAARFDHAPRYLGSFVSGTTNAIALENLRASGFAMAPKGRAMHRAAVELTLAAYAELHAFSFAMRDQDRARFEALARELCGAEIVDEITRSTGMDRAIKANLEESAAVLAERGASRSLLDKIEKLGDLEIFKVVFEPGDRNAVITHGDCWINNFLFKFEDGDETKCRAVKLLDWQISKMASPVMDLSYFLIAAISGDDLDHLDELLSHYHAELSERIRRLGGDADALYPLAALRDDWSRYARDAATKFPGIAAFQTMSADDAPDFDEMARDGGDITEGLKIPSGNPLYVRRLTEIMMHPEFEKMIS